MPTEKTIGSFFTFESNKVKIECEFTTVRDLYFQQQNSMTRGHLNVSESTFEFAAPQRKVSAERIGDAI